MIRNGRSCVQSRRTRHLSILRNVSLNGSINVGTTSDITWMVTILGFGSQTKGDLVSRLSLNHGAKVFSGSSHFTWSSWSKFELSHKDAVLLLDEPGLHLHPTAQQELIAFFDELANSNILIYSTHSPFLIDGEHIHRVRPVTEDETGHSRISTDGWPNDRETIFPLQAAVLDMRWYAVYSSTRKTYWSREFLTISTFIRSTLCAGRQAVLHFLMTFTLPRVGEPNRLDTLLHYSLGKRCVH